MKIAVSGGKGGTGKSMVATSLAYEFAQKEKTLLVDADVECPNDHLLLSIDRKKETTIFQPIPKWDKNKCTKCGLCADVCKQEAIVFVKDKFPAFIKDLCIGCQACKVACPVGAISMTKKEIGTVHSGKKYDVNLLSGELKIGELASGEIVAEVRKFAKDFNKKLKAETMIIDSAAGIGCPVIASIVDTDFVVLVTEPSPSALNDLKRILHVVNHFGIPNGLVINKYNMSKNFYKKIEQFAKKQKIEILGEVPYHQDFVQATINMKPIAKEFPKYQKIFQDIKQRIKI